MADVAIGPTPPPYNNSFAVDFRIDYTPIRNHKGNIAWAIRRQHSVMAEGEDGLTDVLESGTADSPHEARQTAYEATVKLAKSIAIKEGLAPWSEERRVEVAL